VFIKPIGFVALQLPRSRSPLITKIILALNYLFAEQSGLPSSAITTTTATISWSAAAGANNYDIDYKRLSSTWINAAYSTTSLKSYWLNSRFIIRLE
jgi:hypothetical protein